MSTTTPLSAPAEIEYPESDGELMADNTEQLDWIIKIKSNLECLFRDDPNVFVAGDLLWYPVEGDNKIRHAPDVLVAFGRPKGRRGAYVQCFEGGIAPQVVFEILSPGNRGGEMTRKHGFYETYGVEEYYVYDPEFNMVEGWLRDNGTLKPIDLLHGWVSPRLGVRFELTHDELRLYRPDGQPFITETERDRQNEELQQLAQEQQRETEEHRRRADAQQREAEEQYRRAERLAAQLKALGIEPEA